MQSIGMLAPALALLYVSEMPMLQAHGAGASGG